MNHIFSIAKEQLGHQNVMFPLSLLCTFCSKKGNLRKGD